VSRLEKAKAWAISVAISLAIVAGVACGAAILGVW